MTYKIAILEKVNKEGLIFHLPNLIIRDFSDKSRKEILQVIDTFDIIVIKSRTIIDKEFLNIAKKLKIIARAGIGLENIDTIYAKELSVRILTTPDANIVSTAEFTISIMLSLVRFLPNAFKKVEKLDFRRHLLEGREISEMTVGIIGLGRVGLNVAKILSSFSSKIIAYSPIMIAEDKLIKYKVQLVKDLNELLSKSDIISIHLPLKKEYISLLNKAALSKIKKGAYVINTSRGEMIDEDSLIHYLDIGHISGAALDVITDEPRFEIQPALSSKSKNLINHPKVIYTPHMAASTIDAQRRISFELAKEISKIISK